jgi:large subunit ribosomal protein L30
MIQITLKRSPIATTPNQRENLKGLGLLRREQTVLRNDTPSIRGMIQKVLHLVEVRKGNEAAAKAVVSGRNTQLEVIPPKEASAAPKAKKAKTKASKKEKAS